MAGPCVGHALDGGLVGEEVAAVDGVVEVLEGVSPSPLRFLAALMPPCAQTECERLTGTMEKRSTLPPASAILMTAARPARPPPTTMILGVAAIVLPQLVTGFGYLFNVDRHCTRLLRIDRVRRRNCRRWNRHASRLLRHYIFRSVRDTCQPTKAYMLTRPMRQRAVPPTAQT